MATPICRCRVLYLGSCVPHMTKDGLQGMQEPLRQLYTTEKGGIDSWLSVWSNGILLENQTESRRKVTKFYPMDSLHFCAAVRHVLMPNGDTEFTSKFLPLDSPFARIPNDLNPPLFACTLRRTSGIKILECHLFICKKEVAANALNKCCFQAYADTMLMKKLESDEKNAYSPLRVNDYDSLVSVYGSVSGRSVRSSVGTLKSTLRRTFGRPKPMLMPAMFLPPPSQPNTVKKCKRKNASKKMFRKANCPPSPLWMQLPAGGRATPIYQQQLPPIPSYSRTSTLPCYSIKSNDEPYFLPSRSASCADFYNESHDTDTLCSEAQHQKKKNRKSASIYSSDDNGIYNRKPLLNEKAFSHSIRQERQSRSHSSISNALFNGNSRSRDMYAEDDITQMVSRLNLLEDGSDDSGHQSQNGTLTNKRGKYYKRGEC